MKLNVIAPMTLTGTPLKLVLANFHPRAAATAASFRSGCPDIGFAEMTSPDSSMVTSTTTEPEICAALASGGYAGSTRRVAEACNTPPDFLIIFGTSAGSWDCCCRALTATPVTSQTAVINDVDI